jgi:hypothetical protein
MKASIVSALLFGAAVAAPVNEKRGVVYDEVVVTEWTTTTVYTEPTGGAFYELFGEHSRSSAQPTAAASSSSWSSSYSPSAAPTSSSAPPALPAVVTPSPPAPPPVESPAPAAPSPAAPAPATAAPAAPASGGGPSGTGDITFYSLGQTSCGGTYSDSDPVVALSWAVMNNGANPNNNPLCGKSISITYNGVTASGIVQDTCQGCNADSIDLSPSLFEKFGSSSAGRISGVTWSVA